MIATLWGLVDASSPSAAFSFKTIFKPNSKFTSVETGLDWITFCFQFHDKKNAKKPQFTPFCWLHWQITQLSFFPYFTKLIYMLMLCCLFEKRWCPKFRYYKLEVVRWCTKPPPNDTLPKSRIQPLESVTYLPTKGSDASTPLSWFKFQVGFLSLAWFPNDQVDRNGQKKLPPDLSLYMLRGVRIWVRVDQKNW